MSGKKTCQPTSLSLRERYPTRPRNLQDFLFFIFCDTRALTHARTYTHARMHARMHAHTHTHTHKHTHTHTHSHARTATWTKHRRQKLSHKKLHYTQPTSTLLPLPPHPEHIIIDTKMIPSPHKKSKKKTCSCPPSVQRLVQLSQVRPSWRKALLHTSAYVSIRQHTSAHVSIRQHTSAHVSIRQLRVQVHPCARKALLHL